VDPEALRQLPSVDRLAGALDAPHGLAVTVARRVIDERRRELAGDGAASPTADLVARAQRELTRARRPTLRRVLNATGVIVHTNLGRAPLSLAARAAVARVAAGYSSVELDLDDGRRGSRHAHVSELLRDLTGASGGLAVNNGAGAALLAVAAMAGPGGAVVVSRGQLVEIGGGFRIPDVIGQAGARLVEVGTTNRTRIEDYERAVRDTDPDRTIVLRVHTSNFRTVGFVESVEIEPLCRLGVPVVDDLGSGALGDRVIGVDDEPEVRRSVRAGVALACFSGDKLLGGPQAGVLVGQAEAVERAARHPLARALRIDKLSLAALAATLELYLDPARARAEIPVLAMLQAGEEELRPRAERILAPVRTCAEIVREVAYAGGGALPLLELAGPVVAVRPEAIGVGTLASRLREGQPAVVGRLKGGRLLLDPRTLTDAEADDVGRLVRIALEIP
jgi:L-seryl-tRNA(Ser) seleniumtransferase